MNGTALPPYAIDLLLVVPRLAQRARAIAFHYLPDQFDGMLKKIHHPRSIIAEATEAVNLTAPGATTSFLQTTVAPAPAAMSTMQGVSEGIPGIFSLQNLRGMGGFVSYITSRWAITTVLVSLLLNRTLFYASSRMPLTLRWHVRLALYLAPIVTLLYQTQWLLQAMRCQTSPQWSMLRYHDPERRDTLDYAGEGGVLYYLASALTYWQDDHGACSAVNMVPLGEDQTQHQGSLPLLWPTFLTFCFSQFIETIACAVQGRQPKPEVGMTLFEHSLAYSEAEALITKPLDLGLAQAAKAATDDGKAFTPSRSVFLQGMNVPPEVLLLSLISCLSHLSSHVLAVLGWRSRVRLVNTGAWALAYMCMFAWSFIRLVSRTTDADDLGIFRIPTVILVGFIPHLTILLGLAACAMIYGLALLLTMLSLPPGATQPRTLRERLLIAYGNLQANVQLSAGGTPVRIDWQEDFYTALLKAGFTLLTAASEAVYLNQGSKIRVSPMTWLEERRIAEITRNRGPLYQRTLDSIPSELHNRAFARDTASTDLQAGSEPGHFSHSGYARERRTRKANGSLDLSTEAGQARGVGFAQRHSRWSLSLAFSKGIFWLVAAFNARLLVWLLDKLGIAYRPHWLRKLAGDVPHSQKIRQVNSSAPTGPLQFWMLSEDGELTLPKDNNFDVEAETRRRFEDFGLESKETEEAINENLYGWWKFGGWWGEVDTSGDYQQQERDDDLTSVTTVATELDDSQAWSDVGEDGQRTPTQQNPFPSSRESTPLEGDLFDNSRLATLLDPQTVEQQGEAHMLARHLRSNRILTRSQYSKDIDRERARILTSSRAPPGRMQPSSNAIRTPDGEERALEQFILSRRGTEAESSTGRSTGAWDAGAEVRSNPSALSPTFMQSEPSEVLQTDSLENTAVEELSTASQHGRQPEDASTPSGFSHRGQEGLDLYRVEHGGMFDASVLSGRDSPSDQDIARLKRPSPPPGIRISEYENALTPSPRRKAEALAFHVVKTSRKPGDKRSPIANMPNEILTHTLSHLSPSDLSAVALVSRRFHSLVTSPHAWRIAFSRFFPGSESLAAAMDDLSSEDTDESLRSERRAFTRLTALASWRSEYILRSRLLRSLARGKPMQILASPNTSRSGHGHGHTASSTVMYNSQLFTTVNHLHATFGTGLNKRFPRFIHGADDVGTASTSDPSLGKIDNWGSSDPQFFLQFYERFPGDTQWGLGPGEVVGNPNVMDVSQPYGMVHGEGSPGGMVYFRSVDEMRGRFLASSLAMSVPELGIPKVSSNNEAICSVWIAKSFAVPSLTEGLIGILSGSSAGIVSAYSLGSDGLRDARLTRGELTARWVLSPGVPIMAIMVDDSYTLKRHAQNRIWAVALNALGELFYLTKLPKRALVERDRKPDAYAQERLAWATGRSVYWNLVEPSRRAARPDPYNESSVDGSYSPRSSWNGMCLSKDQTRAEIREIESYLARKPKDFRKACLGWDMQRRLEVDFAGDDGNLAGESLVVFACGVEEDNVVDVKRFMRCKFEERKDLKQPPVAALSQLADLTYTMEKPSLFGGAAKSTTELPALVDDRDSDHQQAQRLSYLASDGLTEHAVFTEEWRCSELSFGGSKSDEITATAIDISTFALLTMSEDPALGFAGASGASSPFASPVSSGDPSASATDIPGQRARFVAAGTKAGNVFLWNIRAPASRNAELINVIDPVRIIYTDSPQISCLALTALQLVHGGNDGLVQAWDPLASSSQPIRTLHSRFSSRARRRLVQAQASPQGVGINLFAAGAICLDPDPTVLRGMVSLGTHLRYWSYSSSAADQYKTHKRRVRRSERSSNSGGGGFSASGRTNNLRDYIAIERLEVEHEKKTRQRESDRLAGRFGTDLLGSEEEALAYAALLSEESLAQDLRRQTSGSSTRPATPTASLASAWSTKVLTPPSSSVDRSSSSLIIAQDDHLDPDLAKAIRLSLGDDVADVASYAPASPDLVGCDVPFRYAKSRKSPTASRRGSPVGASAEWREAKETDELEFALQLSLAEEQSRKEMGEKHEEFRALTPSDSVKGKGKGRA